MTRFTINKEVDSYAKSLELLEGLIIEYLKEHPNQSATSVSATDLMGWTLAKIAQLENEE